VPTTVTQGSNLPGGLRINSASFTHAVGAAHVIVSWDPAKLQLDDVALGDYARAIRWFDNTAGVLHLIATDPDITKGDRMAAGLTFDVIGGSGTTTTIETSIESLISENFQTVVAAVANDVVVTIN
jgi:hypothetical protein